jgi:S-adenosylmethionine:tRNA ribosyltransferase-isomerase
METKTFSFDLPPEQIAQYPPAQRGDSRLLVMDRESGELHHSHVSRLAEFLEPGTLLVRNDSRVRKARVYGRRADTGGRAEFLFLEREGESTWRVLVHASGRPSGGTRYRLPEDVTAELQEDSDQARERRVSLTPAVQEDYFERNGHVPLPPYIKRPDDPADAQRYQTIFAREAGSVAAPTAGLHFTDELFERLSRKGVEIRSLTLHVGLGTFQPVRTERVEEHRMHGETFTVSEELAEAVSRARAEGRAVLAVGTTTVRALEAAARATAGEAGQETGHEAGQRAGEQPPEGTGEGAHERVIAPGTRSTDIFIYPGFEFRVIDKLFTNFHTPESSLLMMVCAFGGTERTLAAYREAVSEGYRFYSYGDAMLFR